MYVLIDRHQMAITHKHSDREALSALAWIECTNDAATLPLGNVRLWAEFTPAELRKIYQNATGAELKGYGTALAQVVSDMAKRLPESDIVPAEVRAQKLCIMDGDKSHYSYLKGSMTPKVHDGLFEAECLTCARSEAEELRAAQSAPPAYTGATTGGTSTTASGANGTATPRAPAAPRAGGTREIIFAVADKLWEAAGKPTALPRVLELRKQMMAVLEAEHAVKKTTSSTALGDWQKQRLS